jgi:uncharacterized protein (DUF697 family)
MIRSLKHVRSAMSLVNPEEVRRKAERTVSIGLVAASDLGYSELENFLAVDAVSCDNLYRAGDPDAPPHVDLVLYEQGLTCPQGAFRYQRDNPEATIREILEVHEDLSLALARHYPVFRKAVVERIVQAVARENALFAIATALPNVVPNLLELPWAVSEFASDTIFLTVNQIRMAFLIAAASGSEVGVASQKGEIISIAAGALGWRAIARELAGKIPLGGGLIPKGAIAYAATFVIGKSLELYHHAHLSYTAGQREEVYQQAFERGKTVAGSLSKEVS